MDDPFVPEWSSIVTACMELHKSNRMRDCHNHFKGINIYATTRAY
jgi:hypothetical protein